MISALKQLWNAWRDIVQREEMRWREQSGDGSKGTDSAEACASPNSTPTIADLVRQRQQESELHSTNGGRSGGHRA